MKVEQVDIAKLVNDPANARTHDRRNLDAIKGSLAKFGQQKPIVIDAKGVVIAGNGTLAAARELGWHKIAVVRSDLAGVEATAYAIADNRTAELAAWDGKALAETIASIAIQDEDLAKLLDFPQADLDALIGMADAKEVVEDEVPEPPPVPITKPGDLWLLGDHRLLCGDSTKAEDVARLMGGERAVLCFTSPPYSDMREYRDGVDVAVTTLRKFIPAFSKHTDFFAVNLGVKRNGGEVDEYWQEYLTAGRDAGLKLLSWNVWNREHCGFSVGAITAMFAIQHEFIFVLGPSPKKLNLTVPNKEAGLLNTHIGQRQADGTTAKQDDVVIRSHRQLGTVQTIGTQLARNEGIDHPAMMPVALPAAYFEAMTDIGDIVADPFLGSGTTLIAAEQLGRKCYGMEISPQYCDVIVKRWETLTGKQATLDTKKGGTNG